VAPGEPVEGAVLFRHATNLPTGLVGRLAWIRLNRTSHLLKGVEAPPGARSP